MLDVALAQAAPSPGGVGGLVSFVPLLLVFFIFYFILIRPQQKKSKEHREMLEKLKKNDEVITSGGLYGKITALSDNVVTLEVAPNVRVRVHRPQISALVKGDRAPA